MDIARTSVRVSLGRRVAAPAARAVPRLDGKGRPACRPDATSLFILPFHFSGHTRPRWRRVPADRAPYSHQPQGTDHMLELIIQLIAGAVGGNLAGGLLKNQSLGTLGNSIAGVVGGGIGGQILSALTGGAVDPAAAAAASGGLDIGAIISSVAGGGVGGGLLMVIVGYFAIAFLM
jgi:hypothetical protein